MKIAAQPRPKPAPRVKKGQVETDPLEPHAKMLDLLAHSVYLEGWPIKSLQKPNLFFVEFASSAALTAMWYQGDPFTVKFPPEYQSRLVSGAKWLQSLEKVDTDFWAIRMDLRRVLMDSWEPFQEALDTFDRLTSVWFNPDGISESNLPVWADSEIGRVVEQWDVYSGLLSAVNVKLGLDILEMDEALSIDDILPF